MARLFTGLETIENWNPLDDAPEPDFMPSEWHGPHVQKRLAEAWRILHRLPATDLKPKGHQSLWPQYRLEWQDLLALVGAGIEEVEAFYRQMNRTKVLPTAKEISLMEQAIGWPWQYLNSPRDVLIVSVCARVRSFDGDLAREMRRKKYQGNPDQWQQLNWKLCDKIADRLIADRVMVQ
jgi:hypothetical protein